jgi:hypothetical protein
MINILIKHHKIGPKNNYSPLIKSNYMHGVRHAQVVSGNFFILIQTIDLQNCDNKPTKVNPSKIILFLF